MFEHLKKYNNIVISGPQRAGTRITAKIISEDAKKEYIDEKCLNYHDFRLLRWYLSKGNVVIQCPGLCHLLHNIEGKDNLVIIIRRDIEDIICSEHRVWNEESEKIELVKYGYTGGIISEIKYNFWDNTQKIILGKGAKEINFDDLEEHRLFIKDRENFRWDQTK